MCGKTMNVTNVGVWEELERVCACVWEELE